MIKITTTYQVVSPESAEHGEFENQGWYDQEGETFETPKEAAEFLTDNYAYHPSESPSTNAKSWSTEGNTDFITGNEKSYTYHIETDTDTLKEVNTILMGQ